MFGFLKFQNLELLFQWVAINEFSQKVYLHVQNILFRSTYIIGHWLSSNHFLFSWAVIIKRLHIFQVWHVLIQTEVYLLKCILFPKNFKCNFQLGVFITLDLIPYLFTMHLSYFEVFIEHIIKVLKALLQLYWFDFIWKDI